MQLDSFEGILRMPQSAYPIACSVCTPELRYEAIFDGPEGPELLQADLKAMNRRVVSVTAVRWSDTYHLPIH